MAQGPMSLADFRLEVQDGKVYHVGSGGEGRALVCNFVPKRVRCDTSGTWVISLCRFTRLT